jgi:predicted NBD/HSP70 family sugar kinase
VLAADVGGTTTAAGLVSLAGEVLFAREAPTRAGGPGTAVETLLGLLAEARARAHRAGIRVRGCGIGVAGVVDAARGVVGADVQNLPELAGYPLARAVAARLGLPTVVDNDVNALALGEARFGRGRGLRAFVLLALGTGVGGGIVLGGELVRGASGYGGELGHVTVKLDGRPCVCGARGCLKAYAAGPDIVAQAREALAGAGGAPDAGASAGGAGAGGSPEPGSGGPRERDPADEGAGRRGGDRRDPEGRPEMAPHGASGLGGGPGAGPAGGSGPGAPAGGAASGLGPAGEPRPPGGSLAARAAGPAGLTARDVFAAAAAGDPLARDIVDGVCRALGAAIGGILNGLNPEAVFLTGGVARSLAPHLDAVRRWARAYAFAGAYRAARIALLPGAKGTAIRGAAALFLHEAARPRARAPAGGAPRGRASGRRRR